MTRLVANLKINSVEDKDGKNGVIKNSSNLTLNYPANYSSEI